MRRCPGESCVSFTATVGLILLLLIGGTHASAQDKQIDGKSFTPYKSSHFRPHRGLFYSVFVSPVLTVDPLGFGGESTYALGAGIRVNLWESKTPPSPLSGLKMTGLYLAAGMEYYPQQYDKYYGSLWLRMKSFIPLVARADLIYATGYGLQGVTYRYGFGFEIRKVTVLLCGESMGPFFVDLGAHPNTESPYANAGAILLVIPVFERKDK
jgi:hypothetical protein